MTNHRRPLTPGNHPASPSILDFLQSLPATSVEFTSAELHAAYIAFPGAKQVNVHVFCIYASRTVGSLLGSRRNGDVGRVYWRLPNA